MQVQAANVAAQAASLVAQTTSKDRSAAQNAAASDSLTSSQVELVEQSGSPNADRDAQGQGDGQLPRPVVVDENEASSITTDGQDTVAHDQSWREMLDDPPPQLDILG